MELLIDKSSVSLGILSDTHGHLNDAVMRVFDNTDAIIHAGDVGGPEIINRLEKIAPIVAVRGNMDGGRWASDLPGVEIIKVSRSLLYVLHDGYQLDLDPTSAGINAVIFGHTHRPLIEEKQGVLYINPGSASMPRHGYAPSVALLSVEGKTLSAKIVPLDGNC